MSSEVPVEFQLWRLELRLSETSEPLNTVVLDRDEAVTYPELLLLRAGRGADAIIDPAPIGAIRMSSADLWRHMVRRYGMDAVGRMGWSGEYSPLPQADPSRPTPAPTAKGRNAMRRVTRPGGVEAIAANPEVVALHLTPNHEPDEATDPDISAGMGLGLPPQGGDQMGAPA